MIKTIPTYALYGEPTQDPQHEWLHWETIQERSRGHGYRIAPHRHEQFFQLLCLTGGRGRVVLDDTEIALVPPCIVLVPPMIVHGYQFSPDVDGIVVTLMARDLAEGMDLPSAGMIRGDISMLQRILDGLIAEADRPGIRHDRAMQAHMALLNVAMHRARNLAVVKDGASLRARNHAQAFSELVDRRFRETRRIADYAAALGVSQTHLNRISREILGASALGVVERRIALEARRQLLFSTLTIKQIGAGLGYDDPGYFTRFLKRILGVAPKTFRHQRDRPDM